MKFEERMANITTGMFDRIPPVFRTVLAFWILAGVPVIFAPRLYDPLPYWPRLILLAPTALLLVLYVLPIVVVVWTRLLSAPFRKAAQFWKRAH